MTWQPALEAHTKRDTSDIFAGDIGSVPVVLLEDCLHACSAQQLARIEDETR